MKNILTAIAAAGALTLATVAAPQPAQARHWHHGGAIIGGLAAGALFGAAIAGGPYYGGPYYGGPYYDGPGPYYYGPACYWRHVRHWNGWRWRWRRVRVCD